MIGYGGYGGFGANIQCAQGEEANLDIDTGETWCQRPDGTRLPELPKRTQAAGAGMGVLGWGVVLAGGLLAVSFMLSGKSRGGFLANARLKRGR